VIKKILFIIITTLLLLWLSGLVVFINMIPRGKIDSLSKTDAIVVLTGGSGRVGSGIALLQKGLAKKLLISGVGQDMAMKDLELLQNARDKKALHELQHLITLGYSAFNTASNAEEARDWVIANNITSIRLVTSNYHLPRSMLEFHKAMPQLTIIPSPVFPEQVKMREWWKWSGTTKLILLEYHKFLRSKLTGNAPQLKTLS
jgi:uncharacterized SAM-binding protein YcdF (DUF218 family)